MHELITISHTSILLQLFNLSVVVQLRSVGSTVCVCLFRVPCMCLDVFVLLVTLFFLHSSLVEYGSRLNLVFEELYTST